MKGILLSLVISSFSIQALGQSPCATAPLSKLIGQPCTLQGGTITFLPYTTRNHTSTLATQIKASDITVTPSGYGFQLTGPFGSLTANQAQEISIDFSVSGYASPPADVKVDLLGCSSAISGNAQVDGWATTGSLPAHAWAYGTSYSPTSGEVPISYGATSEPLDLLFQVSFQASANSGSVNAPGAGVMVSFQ